MQWNNACLFLIIISAWRKCKSQYKNQMARHASYETMWEMLKVLCQVLGEHSTCPRRESSLAIMYVGVWGEQDYALIILAAINKHHVQTWHLYRISLKEQGVTVIENFKGSSVRWGCFRCSEGMNTKVILNRLDLEVEWRQLHSHLQGTLLPRKASKSI